MRFADAEARRAFHAYTIPCFEVQITLKKLKKSRARELVRIYGAGQELPVEVDAYFPIALQACSMTATSMGKTEIDAEAVRRYFHHDHDEHVKESFEQKIVKDPYYCKTWPAIVNEIIDARHAMGKTSRCTTRYRTDLVPGLKSGQIVVVHRAYVSEIIDRETANAMPEPKRLDLSALGV